MSREPISKENEHDSDSDYEPPNINDDSIVNIILHKFVQRSKLHHPKCGTNSDLKVMSILQWILYTQKELMDGILYLEKLKQVTEAITEATNTFMEEKEKNRLMRVDGTESSATLANVLVPAEISRPASNEPNEPIETKKMKEKKPTAVKEKVVKEKVVKEKVVKEKVVKEKVVKEKVVKEKINKKDAKQTAVVGV